MTISFDSLADELEPYFRSGNDMPVTQATIPAELAHKIIEALRLTEVLDRHAADCQASAVRLQDEVDRLHSVIEGNV